MTKFNVKRNDFILYSVKVSIGFEHLHLTHPVGERGAPTYNLLMLSASFHL